MARTLRVAAGQMAGLLNYTAANIDTAAKLAVQAAEQGARLILLPEAVVTGISLAHPAKQAVLDTRADAFTPLVSTAAENDIVICAGFVTGLSDGYNVVHAIIQPDGQVLFQHKAFAAPGEPSFLVAWPDPRRVVFTVDGVQIVVLICSETASEAVQAAAAPVRPELILHPSAGALTPEQVRFEPISPDEEAALRSEMLGFVEGAARIAAEQRIPRLAANPIGFDGETYWPGNSYGVDARGSVCLHMPGVSMVSLMAPSMGVVDLPVREDSDTR